MILAEMNLAYVVMIASNLLFGVAAVLAMAWAFKRGQMENFTRGAHSIFDADEPLGEITDDLLDPSRRNRPQ